MRTAACRRPDRARFCCYGCELAASVQAEAKDDHAAVRDISFTLVLSMIVMMLPSSFMRRTCSRAGDVEMAWLRGAYRWASFVLATPVLVLAGAPLARRAVLGLRRGRLSMDALILVGALAAYVLSVDVIFEADMRCTSILRRRPSCWQRSADCSRRKRGPARVARSGRSSKRRGDGCAFARTGPRRGSSRRTRSSRACASKSTRQIVPVDFRLETEMAELDVSVLTGESSARQANQGRNLASGRSPHLVRNHRHRAHPGSDSAIDRLARLAASLQARPSTSLVWADLFATALTPSVALVGAATVAFWMRAGSPEKSVIAGLAVVLAACPCTVRLRRRSCTGSC